MIGYDLDDTLAKVDFTVYNNAQLMANYENAKVLYVPTEDFVVITARNTDARTRYYTLKWLEANQPKFKKLYMVGPASEAKVVERKAALINELGLIAFYDNNAGILKTLKGLVNPSVKLYHMVNGKATLY